MGKTKPERSNVLIGLYIGSLFVFGIIFLGAVIIILLGVI